MKSDFGEHLKETLLMTNNVMLAGMKAGQTIGQQESARTIKRLVNALLDVRGYVVSGRAEMHIIDEALEPLGIEPWKTGFKREDVLP